MTELDPNIVLKAFAAPQLDIAGSVAKWRTIADATAAAQRRQVTQGREDTEYARQQDARTSLADLVASGKIGGGKTNSDSRMGGTVPLSSLANGIPQTSGTVPPPAPDAASGPWDRYVRADPKGALQYRKDQFSQTKARFDLAHRVNDASLEMLGGVYDQASYDRAKQSARALYEQYGTNFDDLNLPEAYSPEMVRSLQMRAMDARHQMTAMLAEHRLQWNQDDDQLDNARADRNTDSLITDRTSRRGEARRYHDQADGSRRRGQDMRPATRSVGGRRGAARPTATGPNGEKVEFDGKAWVPVQ